MRIAYNDEEAVEGFRLATDEAINSFGDGRCFVEKFVESPHHIELQVRAAAIMLLLRYYYYHHCSAPAAPPSLTRLPLPLP